MALFDCARKPWEGVTMTDAELWFTRAALKRDAPDLAPLMGRLFPADADDGES